MLVIGLYTYYESNSLIRDYYSVQCTQCRPKQNAKSQIDKLLYDY